MAFWAMEQRTFDFDQQVQPEPDYVAESTSLPPPPLVRPDRQLTYDGAPHYEWPKPEHNRDTITVDRIREDIDGPSHRFVIRRGDTVEVLLRANRTDIGEVTGVSHRNHEVRVSFSEGSDGIWLNVASIYPTAEELPCSTQRDSPLSEVIAKANVEPPEGFSEADRVPAPSVPYSFDEYKQFRRDFADGSLSYFDYQAQFARLCQSHDAIVGELISRFKASELTVIASRMGSWDAKRSTKAENAESIFRRMLSSFVPDGSVSYSMGERYEDVVKRKVESVTPEEFKQTFAEREAKAQKHQKALTNPKTFFEFRTFLQSKSESDLTDDQLALYDALHADMTRERRAGQTTTIVEQFQSSELQGYDFQIKEGFHDKRRCPVWIVQLSSRVERATFDELNRKAKMLGGWYSSFKKSDAGFQFLDVGQANRFTELLSGNADRTDVLESRKERRELSASERLHEIANELANRADETIERSDSSLQNTARRADIQAGVRGRAYADQALARTMHSIAETLSRGQAKYLDGIRHKTHIETLDSVLCLAKWARVRAARKTPEESSHSHGRQLDRIQEELIGSKDVRFAEYPFPHLYKRNLTELVERCHATRGLKQASVKLQKRLSHETDDFVIFREANEIEAMSDFFGRAKNAGIDVGRIEATLEKYKRLKRANIHDIHELRSALREYLDHRAEARGDDPVKVAERELIGKKLPGFFPTPNSVINRMLELAEICPAHSILEPSCGKGDILDALKGRYPEAAIHAIEQNRTLAEVLSAKGYEVEFNDFLEHRGSYDRIVMNPPFENGAEIEHVRHAYSLLRPGGRLVSVMSVGPLSRSDQRSKTFREWLDELPSDVVQLPENSFSGIEAFRETSVRTALVSIDKR